MEGIYPQQMPLNRVYISQSQFQVETASAERRDIINGQLDILGEEFLRLGKMYSASLQRNQEFAENTYKGAIQLYKGARVLYDKDLDQELNPLICSMMDQAVTGLSLAELYGYRLSAEGTFQLNLFHAILIFEGARTASDGSTEFEEKISENFKLALDKIQDLFQPADSPRESNRVHEALSRLCEVHEFFGYYLLKCGKGEGGIFHLTQFLNAYDRVKELGGRFHYAIDLPHVYQELSKAYKLQGDKESSFEYGEMAKKELKSR